MRSSADTSVVVPAYRSERFLGPCLESVLRSGDRRLREIIVVDDASPDSSAAVAASFGEPVRVLSRKRNGGFAQACNEGARAVRPSCSCIVFLNADTVVETGWLDAIAEPGAARREIGVVGARCLLPDGRSLGAGMDATGTPYALGVPREAPEVRISREVHAVCGAALWIRRDLFLALDGFDPGYRMYFEDTDLCLRARFVGYRVWYWPASTVTHTAGHSFESREARLDASRESARRFVLRFGGASRAEQEAHLAGRVRGALNEWIREGLRTVAVAAAGPPTDLLLERADFSPLSLIGVFEPAHDLARLVVSRPDAVVVSSAALEEVIYAQLRGALPAGTRFLRLYREAKTLPLAA